MVAVLGRREVNWEVAECEGPARNQNLYGYVIYVEV